MKLLVIGSGGREHALVWKLAQSPHLTQLWCAPGNAGIAQERLASNQSAVECVNLGAEDLPRLLAFALERKPALTVVGPDNPLALGIVDLFQKNGLRIWGPNQQAAQFESSKAFSQGFMERHGIPTARSGTFSAAPPAKDFAQSLGGRCVVKADGLALGKGVILCQTTAEAAAAIDEMLVARKFGAAGAKVIIQEMLEGMEISLHAICDGKTARLFPTSQDHKRIGDGDTGLNTGGMGTYSPTPFLGETGSAPMLHGCRHGGKGSTGDPPVPVGDSPTGRSAASGKAIAGFVSNGGRDIPPGQWPGGTGGSTVPPNGGETPELAAAGRGILLPWLKGCAEESIDFRGILYPGVILTKEGPKVLEFNARFGDPETQVYLPRLENDLLEVIEASVDGTLGGLELRWRPEAAVCVVMASAGYPGSYSKGKVISGLEKVARLPNTKVFHAGTAQLGGSVVTSGGRVLGVTAWAKGLAAARDRAYEAVRMIQFDGAQYRGDITGKAKC